MHVAEAQAEPEAEDPVHDAAAELPGEEVQGEAVPQHLRAGGVQCGPQTHRDPGGDHVTICAKGAEIKYIIDTQSANTRSG